MPYRCIAEFELVLFFDGSAFGLWKRDEADDEDLEGGRGEEGADGGEGCAGSFGYPVSDAHVR